MNYQKDISFQTRNTKLFSMMIYKRMRFLWYQNALAWPNIKRYIEKIGIRYANVLFPCNVRQKFSPALKLAENYQESSGTVIFVTRWKPRLNDLLWQKEVWKWHSWKKYVEMLTSSKLMIDWTHLTSQKGTRTSIEGLLPDVKNAIFVDWPPLTPGIIKKLPGCPWMGPFFL